MLYLSRLVLFHDGQAQAGATKKTRNIGLLARLAPATSSRIEGSLRRSALRQGRPTHGGAIDTVCGFMADLSCQPRGQQSRDLPSQRACDSGSRPRGGAGPQRAVSSAYTLGKELGGITSGSGPDRPIPRTLGTRQLGGSSARYDIFGRYASTSAIRQIRSLYSHPYLQRRKTRHRPTPHGRRIDGTRIVSVGQDDTGEAVIRRRDADGKLVALCLPPRQFGTLARGVLGLAKARGPTR